MNKPGPTQSGNTTSTVQLPAWFQNAWQQILGQGGDLFNSQAMRTAGLTPDQTMSSLLLNGVLKNYMSRPQIPAYDVFGMGNQWNQGGPMQVAQAGGIGASPVNSAGQYGSPSSSSPSYSGPTMPPPPSGPSNPNNLVASTNGDWGGAGQFSSPLAAAIAKAGLPPNAIDLAGTNLPGLGTTATTGYPYIPSQSDPFTGFIPPTPANPAGSATGASGGGTGGAMPTSVPSVGGASGGASSAAGAGGVGGGLPSVSSTAQQATADQAQAAQMDAAQLRPNDIAPYMNPYIQLAVDPTLNRLRQQELETQANLAGRDAASQMFGGSRGAVGSALADRDYRDKLAETAGNMLDQGWNSASQIAGQNVDRRQNANSTNAQLQNAINLANAQMGTDVSKTNASLGTQSSIANANIGGQLAMKNADVGMFNAGQQNDMTKLFQQLLFTGSQNDAQRFLDALSLQNNMDSRDLTGMLSGLGLLNQFGGQQQTTMQNALNNPQALLAMLASLLGAGGNPGGTTTGTNTTTQSKPVDFGSLGLGLLGLLM